MMLSWHLWKLVCEVCSGNFLGLIFNRGSVWEISGGIIRDEMSGLFLGREIFWMGYFLTGKFSGACLGNCPQ